MAREGVCVHVCMQVHVSVCSRGACVCIFACVCAERGDCAWVCLALGPEKDAVLNSSSVAPQVKLRSRDFTGRLFYKTDLCALLSKGLLYDGVSRELWASLPCLEATGSATTSAKQRPVLLLCFAF